MLRLAAAVLALGSGGVAAERALRADPSPPAPGLAAESGRPLFDLAGLRRGDTAQRCIALTNVGPGAARAAVLGRAEQGDLAPHLRAAITRGCADPVLLWSGPLDELVSVADPDDWPEGARREYGITVEVAGEDAAIQGRRAVHEFAFAAEAAPGGGSEGGGAADAGGAAAGAAVPEAVGGGAAAAASGSAPSSSPAGCTTLSLAGARGGRRRNAVLIKYHRIRGRVQAKLIVRVFGASSGRQRLVLVTGLRIGRREVLMGRRWGRVVYRVGRGARVTSRTRPFRVRIAPGVLKPGRNVVRVTTVPRKGRPVRARYVLRIAAAARGETTACRIG